MSTDVIDLAAGVTAGDALHSARRFRETVVAATQASHDALLFEPVPGLTSADRLRVAAHCCDAAGAQKLKQHYQALLRAEPGGAAPNPSPRLAAALRWAELLTLNPRAGDRAALQAVKATGLSDEAMVALAQLVAFLSYQTRVVAGLKALRAAPPPAVAVDAVTPPAVPATGAPPLIHINGFTNESLQWRSWLTPLDAAQATPLQNAVLDESHAQARASEYYLTLIHQPLMLRHRSAAYNAIMYANGGAPRAERELAAMVVSVTNGCVYCTSVHAQRYAQLARRHDTVEQVFIDPASAGTSPRERAVVGLARAITLRADSLAGQDFVPLRAQGMSDVEVLDVLHAASIFGWANRLMHNLGEPVWP